jgi:predicted GNAT family N-acyltransferase
VATPKRTKDTPSAVARNDAGTAELLAAIRDIWESARLQAARSVNSALVQANWLIGRQVVEAEQRGKSRAAYSSRLLKTLSETLEKDYGNGFSVSSLQYMRAFYLGYPALLDIQHAAGVGSERQHAVRVESAEAKP